MSRSELIERNQFREGIGLVLQLSTAQTQQVTQSLKSFEAGTYNVITNNCADPAERALESAGVRLGTSMHPYTLGERISDAGLVRDVRTYLPVGN